MSFQLYSQIEAMNWSRLKVIDKSPLAFQWALRHPREETEAMAFGTAFHLALLEPELFQESYVVTPDFGDLRAVEGRTTKEEGKANKLRKAEWLDKNQGKSFLDAGDADRIASMVAAVQAHGPARDCLRGAKEQVIQWVDGPTGLACKARVDVRGDRIVDVKTATDVSPRGFGRQAANLLYHGQVAWYNDGAIAAGVATRLELPRFLVAQSVAPFDVAVYEVSAIQLEAGRKLWRRLLDRFFSCSATDWWPGVAPTVKTLDLPAWSVLDEEFHKEDGFDG